MLYYLYLFLVYHHGPKALNSAIVYYCLLFNRRTPKIAKFSVHLCGGYGEGVLVENVLGLSLFDVVLFFHVLIIVHMLAFTDDGPHRYMAYVRGPIWSNPSSFGRLVLAKGRPSDLNRTCQL